VLRVFHREWVKLQLPGDERELFALRIGDVEPARVLSAKLGELVGRPIDDSVVLLDEKTRGHIRSMRGGSGSETANDVHELFCVEGLGKIRLGVAAIGFTAGIGDAGQDHERDTTESHAKFAGERRAVHPRHLHIENDDRRRIYLDDAERLRAVARFDDAEATFGEKLTLDGERLCVVVDDQNRTWA